MRRRLHTCLRFPSFALAVLLLAPHFVALDAAATRFQKKVRVPVLNLGNPAVPAKELFLQLWREQVRGPAGAHADMQRLAAFPSPDRRTTSKERVRPLSENSPT